MFTKISGTTGLYLHPYFCFQKHANQNNGFTCGFDIVSITHDPTVPKVLYQPRVSAKIAVVGVGADPVNNITEVIVVTVVAEFLEVIAVPEVPIILAQPAIQHDLPGTFQHRVVNWNSLIWIAISKPGVFKKGSPKHQILFQNPG